MTVGNINILLDVILIAASIWMVLTVRGIGGAVGKTLTYIVIGTVILGIAHLLATLTGSFFVLNAGTPDEIKYGSTVHRVVVLVGFLVLVIGFRQLQAMKR
ncbi:MAG: hypothetical protein Q9P01_17625 [Anaerolineae bacterium]|nr:hypothetical protein [Anaerolineae bacterium]MDQ7036577.1 hypothetical protein [Anaerolineae bacterium]